MAIFELRCNRFTWINIISPTRADVEHLSELHRDIHPLHLEDLVSHTERPKFDEEDTYLFIVMHFPVWDSVSRISRASEVEFILGRNYLVTVHDVRHIVQCAT